MPLLEIHYHRSTKLTFLLPVLDATVECSFHPFPHPPSLTMTYSVANIFYVVLLFSNLSSFFHLSKLVAVEQHSQDP